MNQPHDPAASQSMENVDSVQADIKMVIDIGNRRSIEIPLSGKVVMIHKDSGGDANEGQKGSGGALDKKCGWLRRKVSKLLFGPVSSSEDDEEYLNNRRGWLMTVATLFIGMAFQAAMQKPAWFPSDWHQAFRHLPSITGYYHLSTMAVAPPSGATAADPDEHFYVTKGQAVGIVQYILLNTVTFATAMSILVVLLVIKKSWARYTMRLVTTLSVMLAGTTAFTFVLASTTEWIVIRWMLAVLVTYGLLNTVVYLMSVSRMQRLQNLAGLAKSKALPTATALSYRVTLD